MPILPLPMSKQGEKLDTFLSIIRAVRWRQDVGIPYIVQFYCFEFKAIIVFSLYIYRPI